MTETETETRLRHGLDALAAETMAVVQTPPIRSLERRARARARVRATRRPTVRRWPKVAMAAGAGLILTTSAAAAVGVLPGPVESTLREFRSWGFPAHQGAERMASVTAGDLTYEVWRAPLDGGGQCVYERVIGPDGDIRHGGGSSCHRDASPPRYRDRFGELSYPEQVFDNSHGKDPRSAREHSLSSGQLPLGATHAVFEFDDGSSLTVTPEREGYFITTFPGVHDGARIVEVRAIDRQGHTVATS
jgi:hypothetical protein